MTTKHHHDVQAAAQGASPHVQYFYDRYPYPRPVEDLQNYGRVWADEQRRIADFHLFWPSQTYREDYSILIAGCGTSQAAKYAMRWPHAQVTGIDFSATSLRKTEDLKRKHNLDNLSLQQLPVERAEELGGSFDQIICTGVLHHLVEPDAGLRALRQVLKPDGVMHLMLYAPYGRTGIYMLQDFCRRLGISASDDAILDLITALKALPPGHPMETILRTAPDFGNDAELADALLHPQDRAYSVPEFFEFLQKAGLAFGRWTRQAPYSAKCGVVAALPQTAQLEKLPLNEQFAAVELFRGTMVRHSAVVYHSEHAASRERVSFSDDRWLDYVPIRMADTVCVLDRLPAGAAAVLINRGHTFRDLFLPITALQKQLLDSVDGNRTIAEIVRKIAPAPNQNGIAGRCRDFFSRLWWQDQVVFDTSQRSKPSSNSQ